MSDNTLPSSRRPLKTRAATWARGLAAALARRGISPDMISISSVFCALLGAVSLVAVHYLGNPFIVSIVFVCAACCIQFRLLANMLDGMVAVEGGLGGPLGDLYNEFPDRIADVLLIAPVGYLAMSAPWPYGIELGWAAATLALLTAYTRAMGASINGIHAFHGPMAKPHRMFLLTCACLASACMHHWNYSAHIMYVTLVLMILGMLVTIYRRLRFISRALMSASVSSSSSTPSSSSVDAS